MTHPPSHAPGTHKSQPPQPSSLSARTAGPGEDAAREALGDDGYAFLRTRRHQIPETPVSLLADLVWNAAREADRLYGQFRTATERARTRPTPALDDGPTGGSGGGVLAEFFPHDDLLAAARTAQQLIHLNTLLVTYRRATTTEPTH